MHYKTSSAMGGDPNLKHAARWDHMSWKEGLVLVLYIRNPRASVLHLMLDMTAQNACSTYNVCLPRTAPQPLLRATSLAVSA